MTRAYAIGFVTWVSIAAVFGSTAAPPSTTTQNVVLVVVDGLRRQEVFTGADSSLIARDSATIRELFWRPDAIGRRTALMPFLWTSMARDGVVYGDRTVGSAARVANGRNVSYPGYNEILTGRPDPRIRDNRAGRNPNETLLEWLGVRPGFSGRVAAYGTWKTFVDIFGGDRARFVVRAGWGAPYATPRSAADSAINRAYRSTRHEFDDVAPDILMHRVVLNDLITTRPRVLFVGYGEPDEWAHAGRYERYLRSMHVADSLIANLWTSLQALPEYRGTTTLLVTTDHGRGASRDSWRTHDEKTRGSDETFIAVLGPDTPALGTNVMPGTVTASQIAATLIAFLGEDLASAIPGVGAPLRP